MSDSYDDWVWYDNERVEDYLEDRMEEYLERLEADSYSNYYSSYNNKKKKSNEAYEALMRTYVQDLSRITEKLKPTSYTVISGSGPAWFFEPSTRKFIKTERGSEIVVIPGEADEQGRVLVRTMNTFLLIHKEDILDLGYN